MFPVSADSLLPLSPFCGIFETESERVNGPFSTDGRVAEGEWLAGAPEAEIRCGEGGFFAQFTPRRCERVGIIGIDATGDRGKVMTIGRVLLL